MKDRTLKNQKKHINKTLKQFRLAKRLIQLSITGTVSVITASLSFYFCPGFSSQVIKDARSAISFVQTASGQKFHELEDFLKKQTQPEPKIQRQTELSEDTSGTQGIPDTSSVTADTSSVTANTSPVILGKAENLHMEAQTGSDGNSYDAAILDTSMGPMYYYNQEIPAGAVISTAVQIPCSSMDVVLLLQPCSSPASQMTEKPLPR